MTKKRRRSRRRPLEAASDLIYRALCDAGLTDQARRLHIFRCWNTAVGPTIAARTMPESFGRGVLLVRTASPAWQNELMFLRADIIVKLNDLLGKSLVRELKVTSGRIDPVGVVTQPAPRPEPSVGDYEAAQATSLPIADPEVRQAFEHLMAMDCQAKRRH